MLMMTMMMRGSAYRLCTECASRGASEGALGGRLWVMCGAHPSEDAHARRRSWVGLGTMQLAKRVPARIVARATIAELRSRRATDMTRCHDAQNESMAGILPQPWSCVPYMYVVAGSYQLGPPRGGTLAHVDKGSEGARSEHC